MWEIPPEGPGAEAVNLTPTSLNSGDFRVESQEVPRHYSSKPLSELRD